MSKGLPILEFKGFDQRVEEMGLDRAQRLLDASNFCFFLNGLLDKDDIRRMLMAQPIHRVLHIASLFQLDELPKEGGKGPLVEKIIELVTSPCIEGTLNSEDHGMEKA